MPAANPDIKAIKGHLSGLAGKLDELGRHL